MPSDPPSPPFGVVPSACPWKVGLDIGASTAAIDQARAGPEALRLTRAVIPARIAYPTDGGAKAAPAAPFSIGEEALRARDQALLIAPLSPPAILPPARRAGILLDFADGLRRVLGGGDVRPWGVVAVPRDSEDVARRARSIGREVFDRVLFVEDHLLAAMALLDGAADRSAILVDIGARGVRASLAGGGAILHRSVQPFGGEAVEAELRRLLRKSCPQLALTDSTIARMKEHLGFVAPARRKATIRLVLGGAERTIDVSESMRQACEVQVPAILQAVRDLLSRSHARFSSGFQENIFLFGGGASMPGFPERIQAELERAGHPQAIVHRVEKPDGLIALGALKWALATPDRAWESAFSTRPAA